jgi:hypothetical protein
VEFDFRVLFWWEEQEIKRESLVLDSSTNRRVFDQSRFERGILNAALLRVDEDTVATLEDKRWSDVLPFRLVPPMHAVYERATGLSQDELLHFREDVKGYFIAERKNSSDYVTPPELLEFIMLERIGTITRQELRSLSYAEYLKLHTIITIVSGNAVVAPTPGTPDGMPPVIVSGLRGTPGLLGADAIKYLAEQRLMAGLSDHASE